MSTNNGTSPWRIIIIVIFAIITTVRLVSRCSGSSNRSNQQTETMELFEKLQKEQQQQFAEQRHELSKSIFNVPYDSIENIDKSVRIIRGIQKVKNDSVFLLDVSTSIKIPKNSFLIDNGEDSLRFVAKFPDNTNLYMHSVKSSEDSEKLFSSLKEKNISKLKLEKIPNSEMSFLTYGLKSKNKKYNGFALLFNSNGFQSFFEFEDDNLSQEKLQKKALLFMSENITQGKE